MKEPASVTIRLVFKGKVCVGPRPWLCKVQLGTPSASDEAVVMHHSVTS